MTGYATSSADALDPSLVQALAAALRGLRYGTAELVVHDARVVQLERRVKVAANYLHTAFDGGAATDDREDENAILTRFQVAF